MKKRDERLADSRLEKMGIVPRIYHFDIHVEPFTAITIAEDRLTWAGVRRELDNILPHVRFYPHERATRVRKELRKIDLYGVAICDGRDPLNRQRGRTIAKGRLWRHLKSEKRGRIEKHSEELLRRNWKMTLQEPRGDETEEGELQRLGIQKDEERK